MVTFRGSGSGSGPGPWSPGTKTCSSLLNLIITDGKRHGPVAFTGMAAHPCTTETWGLLLLDSVPERGSLHMWETGLWVDTLHVLYSTKYLYRLHAHPPRGRSNPSGLPRLQSRLDGLLEGASPGSSGNKHSLIRCRMGKENFRQQRVV